jgi:hypothetical protein
VMDDLSRPQFTPQVLFHREAMRHHVLSIDPEPNVPLGIDNAPTLPVGVCPSRSRSLRGKNLQGTLHVLRPLPPILVPRYLRPDLRAPHRAPVAPAMLSGVGVPDTDVVAVDPLSPLPAMLPNGLATAAGTERRRTFWFALLLTAALVPGAESAPPMPFLPGNGFATTTRAKRRRFIGFRSYLHAVASS